MHFLRNALDHLPRKADDDCLMELRWIYDRHDGEEARRDLARWLEKWGGKYAKLCNWVEENREQTLTSLSLPRQHHKHMKSTALSVALRAPSAPPTSATYTNRGLIHTSILFAELHAHNSSRVQTLGQFIASELATAIPRPAD